MAGDLKLSDNTRIVNIGNGFGTRMGLAAHSLPQLLPLVLLLCYVSFYTMKCNNTKITFTVPPTPQVCLRVCTYPPSSPMHTIIIATTTTTTITISSRLYFIAI